MPLPKREKDEEAQKFMSRCMTSEVMSEEYPNQKQRVALCIQQSRAEADIFDLKKMVEEEVFYASYKESVEDSAEELTESNLVVPEEDEWIDLGLESEEVEVASLWDNIRKKKEREGKKYKPAKPGDKDRPQKDAWDRAKGAEYQGKTVKLNKPFRTSKGPKKFSVYVKNEKGNVVKVNFGDPNMEIKRDDPKRRKNFRSRHKCDNPGPKYKARYWSCRMWSSPTVTQMTKSEKEDSQEPEHTEAQTPDLMLKPGVKHILKKEDKDYERGLIIEVNEDGSYNVAYWFDKPEPYPIEVIVDGKSVAKDGKQIKLNFHPEIDKTDALQYGKPKKNDPRKTPAKPSERKKGSKKNKPKSASKPNESIKFGKKTEDSLKELVSKHNAKGKGPSATLGMLKAVYRRGAGAFSTSHAPKMSRHGWAMARVRAFLYLLRNGRPSNPNYKQDNDLLPSSHKRSSK